MTDERYLTPAQVADELHVTVVSVGRRIAHGELRVSKAGPVRWMACSIWSSVSAGATASATAVLATALATTRAVSAS
jgi:hypothetical protein